MKLGTVVAPNRPGRCVGLLLCDCVLGVVSMYDVCARVHA